MESSARESYLVTEVMTATPQKLQLMLIEAVIRSVRRAREKWLAEDDGQACEALIHAQQIMGELLAGLDREAAPELVKRVAAVYLFVFRRLMEANYERSEQKLDEALRVLEIERQTWRRVCEELGIKSESDEKAAARISPQAPSPAPALPPQDDLQTPRLPEVPSDAAGSGLSLEA